VESHESRNTVDGPPMY